MNFLFFLIPYLQQFGLQIFVYLIPIFISISSNFTLQILNKRHFNHFVIYPFFIILMAFINLIFKDFELIKSIVIVQYFLGVFFIVFFLKGKRINLVAFVRGFYSCCLIEYFHVLILNDYPFYIKIYFSNTEINNIFARSALESDSFRLLGPSLNSTVTSTILSVIIVSLFINKIFPPSSKMFFHNLMKITLLDAILIIFNFILCASTTGYLSLTLGLFLSLLIKIKKLRINWKINKNFLISIGFILGIFYILFSRIQNLNNVILKFIELKFNYGYISEVMDLKILDQIFLISNTRELLFGLNNSDKLFIGGDFLLLNFIMHLGIILLILFLILIYQQAKNINKRILITMIIFSSLHYGTAFNIIGQFFLALILTETVDNRNISKIKNNNINLSK